MSEFAPDVDELTSIPDPQPSRPRTRVSARLVPATMQSPNSTGRADGAGTAPRIRSQGAWNAPAMLFAAYAIAMTLLVISAVVDFQNANELEGTTAGVTKSLEASERLRTVGNAVFLAESASRGYVITGNSDYLASYRDMQRRIAARLSEATSALAENPSQLGAMAKLREQVALEFSEMDRIVDAQRAVDREAAMAAFQASDALKTSSGIRQAILDMIAVEDRALDERRLAATRSYRNGLIRAVVASTIVGLALTACYLLMRRYLLQRDAALQTVEATNAALEERVRDRTADLSSLSRHLLDVREEEKKTIARDLHDDFGSYLTAINMDVSRARDRIAATHPEQAQKLERTLGLLNQAIELKRQLISELRPSILDNLGLGAALDQYVEEWSRRSNVAATFDFDGDLTSEDEGCPIAIFRVFQEALANVARHARAKRVAASAFRVGDRIEFEIADDGVGIEHAALHREGAHGLLGIRERVLAYRGTLEIVPGAHAGTVVRGSMPCALGRAAATPRLASFA